MSFPFRAIVSDLDGTLLNHEHRVGRFTIETLEKLANLGVDIIFATGRNYPDLSHIVRKLAINQAMLITANGARANLLSGEQLISHYLPEETAFALMQIPFDPERVCLNSYQGEDWFMNKDIPEFKAFYQESGYCYQVVDFSRHHGRQTEKVFFIGKEPEDVFPIEQQIRAQFGDSVHLTYSAPYCIEVMTKGVCKANTLAELVKMRGYELKDCLVFGDGMNDLEMLSLAGKGCIMRNGDPRLKAALPHNEVIGLNRDEAVASYIRAVFGIV